MKKILFVLLYILLPVSCRNVVNNDVAKNEILQTEKAFEKMASEKGLAEAFYYFADDNAAIRRGNDSLIIGKEKIKLYYDSHTNPNAKLSWTPDFIYVSDCGTLGYTYGKYVYIIQNSDGKITENKGIFHTVWKKQNNNWKYVWD
jgi:ketosteroid isomerase-like protein